MNNLNSNVKRKLMFIKGEDFYYISYNIFILLNSLGCKNEKKKFKDYRKLAFLIEFIADPNLVKIIDRYKNSGQAINPVDKEALNRAYSTGLLRKSQILRLLFSLEKKNLIILEKAEDSDVISVYLNKEMFPKSFYDNDLFLSEIQNISLLKNCVQRITALNYNTLLNRLFNDYGVKTWDV